MADLTVAACMTLKTCPRRGTQRAGAGRLTCPYPGDQDLGVGLAGQFDELGAQVLLKGSPGQRRTGGEFVARLIGTSRTVMDVLIASLCS